MSSPPCLFAADNAMTSFFESQILSPHSDAVSCYQSPRAGVDDEICFRMFLYTSFLTDRLTEEVSFSVTVCIFPSLEANEAH